MRKNWLTTLAGIMVALGTLPTAISYSHVAFPLWWNDLQFPLTLAGLLGGAMLGIAAKGQDEHSTVPQVSAATTQKEANKLVQEADKLPKEVPKVIVVPPTEPPNVP